MVCGISKMAEASSNEINPKIRNKGKKKLCDDKLGEKEERVYLLKEDGQFIKRT